MSTKKEKTHVGARCTTTQHSQYVDAAERLGYGNLSEMVKRVMDAVSGGIEEDGWEFRVLFMDGSKVVGIDQSPDEGLVLPYAAFGMVAPSHFWKAMERALYEEQVTGEDGD